MLRQGTTWVMLFVMALGVGAAYQWMQSRLSAERYRQKLEELGHSYEQLRQTYNAAVTRTAVTELIVDQGRLSVVVRTIQGVEQRVETPFDPYGEVFVDYVVIDGRLLIRRVFDASTPPSEAMVLDSLLGQIDWDSPQSAYGKAVYRRLEEGRWVVTVTGDGSLGLAKYPPNRSIEWVPAPPVKDYGPLENSIDQQISRVGVRDSVGYDAIPMKSQWATLP